ncbi:hypothetical protein [Halobacillus mangrovi]|uniref:Uncharacterized protein n=1 Tax=Halobacillus mangrovi TaxID=402384 RepID=A0A1W5ZXA8_9BACI|nr:hypothetical protein [Halobacillus mangrovi]ARI77900.1 hypothetical protein HM131_14050 [Halobacillus mangrovi]
MIFNFTVGFILPWITAIILFRRARILIYSVVPFTALLSLISNQVGMQSNLWALNPEPTIVLLESLFIDIGYNPIICAWFAYCIYFKKIRRLWVYGLFILLINGLELLALFTDKVEYSDDWNIYYSFIVYVLGLFITDFYYSRVNELVKV